MAAIRFYQSGDYNNTILRKTLENEAAVVAGSLTTRFDGEGGSLPPSFSALGDDRQTTLRKLLKNQTQVLDGRSSYHLR